MDRKMLVSIVARKSGLPKAHVEDILKDTIFEIKRAVVNGDRVCLAEFGTFNLELRNSRTGRNPKTKEAVKIPKRKIASFKAAPSFDQMASTSKAKPTKVPVLQKKG